MNIIQNDTWYLNENNLQGELDFDSMNINECSGGKSFIHYPNIPSGYPSIAVELEDFGGFNLPKNYNSGDEQTAKRYPVTYLEGQNYIVCIPLYEYYTHTGVHVTKVITTLQRNDTHQILIDHSSLADPYAETVDKRDFCRYKYDEDSDIYYICKDEYVKLENICSFSNNKEKDKFLYSVSLGPSCNVQLDLTVDYYFYNIKLGTYKLTFNPYLLDIIKNYNTEEIIPEDNYHGSGVQYIPQFYDIEVNDLYGTIIKEETHEYPINSPLNFDKVELASKEEMQEGKTLNTKEKMLPSNFPGILNNFTLDNQSYLYKSDIKSLEPININYKFKLEPKDCSVAVWAVKDRTQIKDDFIKSGNITIKYIILPKLLDIEEKLFYDSIYSKDGTDPQNDLIKYKIDTLSQSYTYEQKFYTVEQFKNFHLENNSIGNFIIKAPSCDSDTGFGYIPKNSTVASLVGEKNYKDNHTPLDPAGDDTATITLTYDSPFSANNVSDYSVIAQLNTLCKIDDIYYKGYKGPDGAVYKSNINTDYNYLLLNGRSEWNLLFTEGKDYSIKHFENTSLYHSGLIYFEFNKDVKNKEIVLDKGVYFINFNYLNRTAPAVQVKNSPADIQFNVNDNNNVPAVPMRNSLSKIYSNISNNNGILNRYSNISDNKNAKSLSAIIYVPFTSSIYVSIPKDSKFSSIGLYKINEGTEKQNDNIQKLSRNRTVTITSKNIDILDYVYPQTVYTYQEDERKCADKVYNYINGPQHGYQILSTYYTLLNNDDVNTEVSGTTIQIRE